MSEKFICFRPVSLWWRSAFKLPPLCWVLSIVSFTDTIQVSCRLLSSDRIQMWIQDWHC